MGELIATVALEKLKEQELRVSDLEDNVLSHGNYFAEIEAENEEGRKDVEKLKERVSYIEWDLEPGISRLDIFKRIRKLEENFSSLEKRVGELEDQQEERINQLEDADSEYKEKFRVLTVQNIELRDHLNMAIDVINKVVNTLNQNSEELTTYDGQQGDEVTTTATEEKEEDDDEPLTLSQVYNMYQSQPRDKETWQMMTDAIKTAEEYEHEQQYNQQAAKINTLSKEEWADLLNM